ncbi:TolB family protein [Actinomadura sp. ATCC 39365]
MIVNLAVAPALAAAPAQPPVGALPGSGASVVAKLSGRPVQLSSYGTAAPGGQWAWNPAKGVWTRVDGAVSVSPDERRQVRLADRAGGAPKVTFLDRRSGKESEVELPVPEDPEREGQYLRTLWPTWSPDGRRLLLNVFEPGGEPRSAGIVLIDVPSLEARFVRIEKALITVGGFQWTHDGKGVAVRWGKNGSSAVRRYDLTGAVTRTWHVRGRPAASGLGTFSPSGRRFVTACTSLEKAACVWDTRTGRAVTQVKLAFSPVWGPTLGWYDERHLLAPVKDGVGVVDLTGRVVETLVKAGKKTTLYPHFERRG